MESKGEKIRDEMLKDLNESIEWLGKVGDGWIVDHNEEMATKCMRLIMGSQYVTIRVQEDQAKSIKTLAVCQFGLALMMVFAVVILLLSVILIT